jgi:serine protease Do
MLRRKVTVFYVLLIAVASIAVGMVLASRLDWSPESTAQPVSPPAANSAPLTGPIDAATFRNIAKTAEPMVVNIRTQSRQRTQDLTDFFGGDDLFDRFFNLPEGQGSQQRRPREQVTEAAGTGFIISRDGFILTNNHVVEGATRITVTLYGVDDQEFDAKIVGRDALSDSALIQLTDKPPAGLPEAKFGDSSQMQPGDWVMAIGNPFGLAHTVTVGVISAVKRPFPVAEQRFQDVLQTDAAINPGNSGGPLLNVRGEVIGINTAIVTNNNAAANVGIGFAIPINIVRDLLPQLRTGKVTRGRIGVSVGTVPSDSLDELGLKERKGALVSTVDSAGPAAKAGIEPGDVIVEFNGKPVPTRDELVRIVTDTKPGTTAPIKIIRNKQEKTLSVTVEELDLEAESGGSSRDTGTEAGTGFGMQLSDLTPDIARRLRMPAGLSGAVITDIEQLSPAERGGLRPGDVILEVNRQPVANAGDASRELQKVPSGERTAFLVWRGGQKVFLMVRKD